MRVYLDMCCLKRPFDDQSQPRIHLESEAVLALLSAGSAKAEFVRGAALDLENDQNPLAQRAAKVRLWLEAVPAVQPPVEPLDKRTKELMALGLADETDVLDGTVVRQPKAYPVYDENYRENVETVRQDLEGLYPTLHMVGRNGMHKYNNQDHAMMTAMLCAKNIIAGSNLYDLWQVNQDAEYHEAGKAGEQVAAGGLRHVPSKIKEDEKITAS